MSESPRENAPTLPFVTLRKWDRADYLGRMDGLRGRRLILVNEAGSHHDYRAWGELRQSAGALVLDVVTENEWWNYTKLRMNPRDVRRWPACAVWVESLEA